MKTIGLIGGLSWQSTQLYYGEINKLTQKKLGGSSSAHLLIESLNFAEIEALQMAGRWDELSTIISISAQKLQQFGADYLFICSNTMHQCFDHVQKSVSIPVIHIADTVANAMSQAQVTKFGLLGTQYTMEQPFLSGRILEQHDMQVLIPGAPERKEIHRIIFEELIYAKIRENSKQFFLEVIKSLYEQGAEGIVLGCTEITLLIKPDDTAIPLFDTTSHHAREAVKLL